MKRTVAIILIFAALLAFMALYAKYYEPLPEHPSTPFGHLARDCDESDKPGVSCEGITK